MVFICPVKDPFLPKAIPYKSKNKNAGETLEERVKKLQATAAKWTQRSEKIKDFSMKCFTWGPAVPSIPAFLIGLVLCVVFPILGIGVATGTTAAFVLMLLAWAGTYALGAILWLVAKACEAQIPQQQSA